MAAGAGSIEDMGLPRHGPVDVVLGRGMNALAVAVSTLLSGPVAATGLRGGNGPSTRSATSLVA